MKTIGLLGGMSWESTREYYRLLNQAVRSRLGGLHSAEILLSSVDFGPVSSAMDHGDWESVRTLLVSRAKTLTAAGADILLLCTNTMHRFADDVAAAGAPARFLHIGDCAAREAGEKRFGTVALMGTRFTMEERFYISRLETAGLSVLLPEESDRRWIDRLIFDELCAGIFRDGSRRRIADITAGLASRGARAVVLACTELPLILNSETSPLPVIDTMAVHVDEAVNAALN